MDLTKKFSRDDLEAFAAELQSMSGQIGFKVSSRGWGYLLESARIINKDDFDKVENLINKCRRIGLLPVDFVAEESSRKFEGVEDPDTGSIKSMLKRTLNLVLNGADYYTPNWWDGEQFYVQMLVEKIDLLTLFQPVTDLYHIPIANSKGWSSILQRAEYARRFKDAEARGLRCVLLYCGDHDPDGLRISDTIRKNLEQVSEVEWSDGETGYDPEALEIVRFGLNFDFIQKHRYTWIDNLITGSGKNLASRSHPNNRMAYVQEYLSTVGERKCEANAIVTTPDVARKLCRDAIEKVVGKKALGRFAAKREEVRQRYETLLDESGLADDIQTVLDSDDEDDPE